ncbi:hypothetical protein [Gemmata sp.]|uniref:hypothetical protein n=1 Tax=Gemmata sp. TaxID=1914242 RepID=UPI003F71C461
MSNRVAFLIPAPATKGGRRAAKSKRASRARIVLSWVALTDAVDDLLGDLDAAEAAGAVCPAEAEVARRFLVSTSEELLSVRPRLKAPK